ncbi:UNVERIFIED_CONTAM: Nuclear transcription factor Y subunit B-10 [Sesamum latifolium]|uniref:Nuclear transcription factor Y subunit B-10 n=1 Tax=Sesamum latifolium TaxID=2727402 RepID=A0AAW2TZZ6_9LAMI
MADGQSSQGAPGSPAGGSHESGGDQSPRSGVREQDRFLPIANISRIMKKALPANGKIAKDAKETVQECVSEFISFITSEASDKCQREKRKTINGDDLIWAMATLGFEDYIDPLKGDTKGSAKGADGSGRKDGLQQPIPNSQCPQLVHQGSFSQGMNYGNAQVPQHLCFWVSFHDPVAIFLKLMNNCKNICNLPVIEKRVVKLTLPEFLWYYQEITKVLLPTICVQLGKRTS